MNSTHCEFYLSKGSIEQLATSESLFEKSSQRDLDYECNATIRLENPTPILRLADFQHFTFCQEKGQRFGLVLTDGEYELTATIDQSLFNLVEDLDTKDDRFLRKGSVILLKQYKILPLRDLLTDREFELEQNKQKRVVCITDLLLLGHYEENENSNDDKYRSDQIENKNNCNKITHLINQLDISLSKTEWSIACKIIAKTNVRQYENSKTGQIGRVQRFLLEDNCGLIELVAFNQFCQNDLLLKIDIDKWYIIKNGDIRKSSTKFKAWPDRKSVDLEIQMSLNCEIFECDESLLAQMKHDLNDVKSCETIDTTKQKKSCSIVNTQREIKEEKKVSYTNAPKLHEKFTKLNQLIIVKPESFVDVIGIVCEIGQVKKMNGSSKLSLRNIKLIDEANIPISVAFWGKQAEDFSYSIGTCLMINKIKVTTFGGLSLSVMRVTSLLEIKSDYKIEIATSIFDWWNDKENNLINDEVISNQKRAHDISDSHSTDENETKKQRQL